jgi:hypothetical protein
MAAPTTLQTGEALSQALIDQLITSFGWPAAVVAAMKIWISSSPKNPLRKYLAKDRTDWFCWADAPESFGKIAMRKNGAEKQAVKLYLESLAASNALDHTGV